MATLDQIRVRLDELFEGKSRVDREFAYSIAMLHDDPNQGVDFVERYARTKGVEIVGETYE